MKEFSLRRHLIILVVILAILSLLYLNLGAADISIYEFLLAIFGQMDAEQGRIVETVFFDIRLPRYLKCLLTGSAMAAAGVLTQGLFRNSLAAPSVLGINAGAGLIACLTYYSGLAVYAFWVLPLASFIGAMIMIALIMLIMNYFRIYSREAILLTGFAFNIMCGAFISLVISFAMRTPQQTPALLHWLMGDFSYPAGEFLWFSTIVIIGTLFFAIYRANELEATMLGDEVAQTLTVKTGRLRLQVLISVALLVGVSVSMVGAVPFVGLIVPHIMRYLFGPHLRKLYLMSLIAGAIFVLGADTLARILKAPGELQTGIILAMIGAPFFILVLIWQKRGEQI